jgi:hypothetical protein
MTIFDMKPREPAIRLPRIYRDCEAILNAMTAAGVEIEEEETDDDRDA